MNKQNLFEGISINSCGISDCGAEWRWDTGKNGFHDFDLWFVLRGKGRIVTERKSTEVAQGSCLLLFPDTRYVGEHIAERLLVMNVHFNFGEAADTRLLRGDSAFINKHIHDISYMSDTVSRVIRSYNSNKTESAKAFFCAALAEYFEGDVPTQRGDFPEMIQAICDRVNISPEQPHSLASFAAEYGYSADYLGRIFSRKVGIPLSEYIANTRINKAKFMLLSTDMSVEHIAESLGYYDTSYFVRRFRRITGISPGKYRKNRN